MPVGLWGELSSSILVRGPNGGGQLVGIEAPVGRVQTHEARHGACHGGSGGVGVVGRLEHDDLVAGLAQRQQCGRDGLGGPDGDEHLGLGVELDAVPGPLMGRHGVAQLGDAAAGRVLVAPLADGGDGDLAELLGPICVRKTLTEIDRVGPERQLGHGGEDGRGEGLQPPAELRVPGCRCHRDDGTNGVVARLSSGRNRAQHRQLQHALRDGRVGQAL